MKAVRGRNGKRSLLLGAIVGLCAFVLPASPAFGEGSADVNQLAPGDDDRQGLAVSNPGGGDRTILQAYAQAGETIQMANSLMGLGDPDANILVFAPGDDPATATPIFDCAASQPGSGRIDSRAEELAGPEPNVGGYDACDFTIPADGAYSIIMVGVDSDNGVPGTVDAPNTGLGQGRTASMWDVTVRDAAGAVQDGRVFSRQIQFRTGGVEATASDFEAFVYTKTGYEYQVNFFDHAGVNWILAPDDLGVIDAETGERTFASFACGDDSDPAVDRPCVHFEAERGPADRTYPVFFNRVDPLVISGPGGLGDTLDYSETPIAPSTDPISDPQFTGSRGEQDATTQGQGGTAEFTSPSQMGGLPYSFIVDIDGNGIFGDDSDFVDENEELAADGNNAYDWNGLDANGMPPACGVYEYEIATTLSEVHFPMFDVENSGGTRIERLSLPADPDLGDPLAASYNNLDPYKGYNVTNGAPTAVENGISGPGFNSWGTSASEPGGTGNTDIIDTWTQLPPIAVIGTLEILCVDLQLTKVAPKRVDRDGKITWRIRVTNNGPGTSSGSTVTDQIPDQVGDPSTSTPGCTLAGHSLECAIGELGPGESTQIVVTGEAPHDARRCVRNSAAVEGEEDDLVLSNNDDRVRTCTRKPRITITKKASKDVVRPGETISYRIQVRNRGKGSAFNLRVCDSPKRHLAIISAPGADQVSPRKACWKIERLKPRSKRTFRVVSRVAADAPASDCQGGGGASNVAKVNGKDGRDKDDECVPIVPPPSGCRATQTAATDPSARGAERSALRC